MLLARLPGARPASAARGCIRPYQRARVGPCRRRCPAASPADEASPAAPDTPPPPPPPRTPPPRTVPIGTKLERVERLGEEAWEGVAFVDRGQGADGGVSRSILLAVGDAAALLAFAAIGRAQHGESLGVGALLGTAWPFLAGWGVGAVATGALAAPARADAPAAAAGRAAKAWAVATPVSLALRALATGHPPEKAFIAVSAGVTLVMLVAWRAGLAAAAPTAAAREAGGAARGNRRGGPLEFFQLLTSLTKRW